MRTRYDTSPLFGILPFLPSKGKVHFLNTIGFEKISAEHLAIPPSIKGANGDASDNRWS